MTGAATEDAARSLLGHNVVVIGAGVGPGLAITRRAKAAGARVVIADSSAGRLESAADEIGVDATARVDPDDCAQVGSFLAGLPISVDHIVVSRRRSYSGPLGRFDPNRARSTMDTLLVPVCVARFAVRDMAAGGSLIFIGGCGRRPTGVGLAIEAALTSALPALLNSLAPEIAPTRINSISTGAAGSSPETEQIAALAVRMMCDIALTGSSHHPVEERDCVEC
jgi:NAD(P)-dependent dehydrogenase (short-subunit alcohol dehydrogenase family)